jgi:death on curing protein
MSQDQVVWLGLADVLALHAEMMLHMSSRPAPLREEGLLESAVLRPQMAAYYDEADLVRQAALLATGIAQAQAFIDGNKRTALAAMETFLRINGHRCRADSLELAQQIEALATRTDSLEAATARFEAWLREHVVPLEGAPGSVDEG